MEDDAGLLCRRRHIALSVSLDQVGQKELPVQCSQNQHSFLKRGRGRGGSEAVLKFSENSSKLVQGNVPKINVVFFSCIVDCRLDKIVIDVFD